MSAATTELPGLRVEMPVGWVDDIPWLAPPTLWRCEVPPSLWRKVGPHRKGCLCPCCKEYPQPISHHVMETQS